MAITYWEMQKVVKEYRKQHPEFWCKVNVSYADLIKLYERTIELQQASVDTEKQSLKKESRLTQINIPVVQTLRIPVPGVRNLRFQRLIP